MQALPLPLKRPSGATALPPLAARWWSTGLLPVKPQKLSPPIILKWSPRLPLKKAWWKFSRAVRICALWNCPVSVGLEN